MKFLLIVCGLILALGGAIMSCGPQQAYCPGGPNGVCADNSLGGSTGSGGMDQSDSGPTIISGTGGQ
jgi:hypothetical protein